MLLFFNSGMLFLFNFNVFRFVKPLKAFGETKEILFSPRHSFAKLVSSRNVLRPTRWMEFFRKYNSLRFFKPVKVFEEMLLIQLLTRYNTFSLLYLLNVWFLRVVIRLSPRINVSVILAKLMTHDFSEQEQEQGIGHHSH